MALGVTNPAQRQAYKPFMDNYFSVSAHPHAGAGTVVYIGPRCVVYGTFALGKALVDIGLQIVTEGVQGLFCGNIPLDAKSIVVMYSLAVVISHRKGEPIHIILYAEVVLIKLWI